MIYSFEDFVLDTERRELRCGNGLVSIEPQVFDLLQFLIHNRDRVVSKDDLIASVWRGRIVSESALSSRMTAARHAVRDSGEKQRLIRTIPRKGVRFVADVREEAPPAVPDGDAANPPVAASPAPAATAYSVTLELPDKPSIVVLPFANLSGDPEQDYFSDGMVEDITIALGRLPWLFVIGSTTAFTYKNRPTEARQVGADLGVRYLLRGSVRKEGDRVRITAELTDASHGRHIWADRFEGRLDSVFDMQDRVAAHVSTMIAPALQNVEIERARRKPTENLSAYDLFLRALPHHTSSIEQNEASLALLHRAIELDPSYSSAYGLAAWCYFWRKMVGWAATDARLNEGIRLAHRAAETADNDSEAMWMAGQTLTFLAGELEPALALIDKATTLNPNAPNAWWASGMARLYLGEVEPGLEHHVRAMRLNPIHPLAFNYSVGIALSHLLAGRYDEALSIANEALAKAPLAFVPALRVKATALGLLGRTEEGRIYVNQLLSVVPDVSLAAIRALYAAPLRRNPNALEIILRGLRLSGMPEK